MIKVRPLAILCAGPVSRSPLARIPHLRRNLVWVKGTSYRVASRAVNALGAGTPVAEITDMTGAVVWLISVPTVDLPISLEHLRAAALDWRNRILLILDSEVESDIATAFRTAGASVATFAPIDADASRYVVEGDTEAIRAVRLLIGDKDKRVVLQIKKGAKTRYLAGANAATARVLPLIAEAITCFRSAGIASSDARAITDSLLRGAMRLYFRAGRRSLKS